ncbi:MAG TPA: hypothetical protein VLG40_01800 [Candidatus Saccharimonas sp.]|nr:hypothetical protein [Candidatus Saccharimonas sp.]
MGFFGALGKILQGKPVFTAGQGNAAQPGAPVVSSTSGKVFPQVSIEHVECRTNGGGMDIDAFIQNYSQGQVQLDKIELFGHTTQVPVFLRPGEDREQRIYDGPRPTATNQPNLELYYKDASGDYFCADHYVEFTQQADRTYTVQRIRFLRVRDV